MPPAIYIGITICSKAIAYRHLGNFQVQFGSAEQQVEITEWIEVAKILTIGGNELIVPPVENFGPAQGVFDRLAEQPGKGGAKEFVPQDIEKAHGLVFHGIHQSNAIDKLTFTGGQDCCKAG